MACGLELRYLRYCKSYTANLTDSYTAHRTASGKTTSYEQAAQKALGVGAWAWPWAARHTYRVIYTVAQNGPVSIFVATSLYSFTETCSMLLSSDQGPRTRARTLWTYVVRAPQLRCDTWGTTTGATCILVCTCMSRCISVTPPPSALSPSAHVVPASVARARRGWRRPSLPFCRWLQRGSKPRWARCRGAAPAAPRSR